jgi:ectoine hydroxylase-related dioxygenase (phytanoyl-CoA dioxygenase family)
MALTAEEKHRFEQQGFIVVQELLTAAQIEAIRVELGDLHERMAERVPEEVGVSWEHDVDPRIQRRIKQLMHAEMISPTINAILRSDRLLDIVEALIGPNICLYHCKLLMKAARDGTVTPWHQDYAYWISDDNRPLMLNCMFQIDDSTPENGCLQMVPGSHKSRLLEHEREGKVFSRFLPGYFQPRSDAVALPLRAGSAVLFGPMIIHGSDANRSDDERRACTIAYNVPGNGKGRCRETLRGSVPEGRDG